MLHSTIQNNPEPHVHRRILIEKLQDYYPEDETEKSHKAKMLSFIDMHEDCFERSLSIGHLTGSCWIENYDSTKFLLTLHKKLGLWLQLGGHADGDNDLSRVALKEAHEESSLKNLVLPSQKIFDIGIHKIPEWNCIPEHYHYDVRFLLRAINPKEEIQISDESTELQWFSDISSIPNNTNPDLLRMFKKWKNGKI